MPSRSRGHTAYATVDSSLADWATGEGLNVSPGRVRAWRRAGLLPAPTERVPRPDGAPPGRSAVTYAEDDSTVAHRIISFLAPRARPGRPASDLALLQFAAGLPISNAVVVDALQTTMDGLRRTLIAIVDEATKRAPEVGPDWIQSESYEKAEALALLVAGSRASSVRAVRGRLRQARQASDTQDIVSILTSVFLALLGDSSFREDDTTLESVLYAFGAHGLVENPTPDGQAVLGDGLAPFADVLDVLLGGDIFQLPDDIQESELQATRELAQTLGTALAAIPLRDHLYYLGGQKITELWQPEDAQQIACVLVFMVKIRRVLALDPNPIIGAIQDQGWITGSDPVIAAHELPRP
jgi:hypothetical protein